MIRRTISSYGAAILMLLLVGCGQIQTPTATRVPSSTFTITPSQTPHPTETQIPTATDLPADLGPFRRVTSLADEFPKVYTAFDNVQVRPLADGSVWVIARQAAGRWNGQTWDFVHLLEEDMLADVDESGRLWVLRQNADEISAWQNGQWTTYGAESGWTSASINTPWRVSTGQEGMVWLPTGQDVRRFDGQRWRIYTRQEMGIPSGEEEDLWIVSQITMQNDSEQAWVGQCYYGGPGPLGGSGIRWFTGQAWQGTNAPPEQDCISAIHAGPAGTMWIGMRDILWRYEPGSQKWTSFPVPDTRELEYYSVTYPVDLMANDAGDVWARLEYCGGASCGTGHFRLYHIHNGEWTQIFDIQESPMHPMRFQQMVLDGKGQAWLFWDGTVYQLLGDEVIPVAELAALGVDVGSDGKLWAVSSHENDGALWVLEP